MQEVYFCMMSKVSQGDFVSISVLPLLYVMFTLLL